MQIGYSFIHLFSIHAFSCPQDLSSALDPVPTVNWVLFYFYLMGFFLSSQVSVSTLIVATRQQIIVIIATTQETFSSSHLPSALVCTYFPAVAQSHRCARSLVKQNKKSQGRNENLEAESLSVSSVRVFPARACARLTDLSGANDKLSPTGELLLTSLISSPTSSVISPVPLLYLVFTHWERLHHLPVSLLRLRRIKALVQNLIRSVQICPRNATNPTSVPLVSEPCDCC